MGTAVSPWPVAHGKWDIAHMLPLPVRVGVEKKEAPRAGARRYSIYIQYMYVCIAIAIAIANSESAGLLLVACRPRGGARLKLTCLN